MADRYGAIIPLQLVVALVPLQTEFLDVSIPLILLLAGTGLIVAEALVPGAQFVVLGIALFLAGGVGVLGNALGLAFLANPLVLAALTLIFGIATFYGYSQFDIYGGESGGQTTSSDSLQGQSGRVTETVTGTDGEVKLESGGFNPYYSARSFDGSTIEEGTEVIVVDPGGGNVVEVESVEADGTDAIDRELERSATADRARSAEEATETDRERERETE